MTRLENLIKEIHQLEEAVSEELRKTEKGLLYKVRNGKIFFEKDVLQRHRRVRLAIHKFLFQSPFLTIITTPVIYSLVFPAIFLDLMVQFYQAVCFPVYEIPKVNRADFVVLDRHKLKYLNWIERLNCTYCGYFNGVIAFVREVSARTEQYWCPIRHALRTRGTHRRYDRFLPYGDEEKFHERLEMIRAKLREENLADAQRTT